MLIAMAMVLAQVPADGQGWDAPPFRNRLTGFATFSVRRSFETITTEVDVATLYNEGRDRTGQYWFRRKVTSSETGAITYSYTSTAACPAALHPLERLEQLPMPQPDVINFGRELGIVVTDGAQYELSGRAIHADSQVGEYSIESNVGTPLAHWVDSMLVALRPCWSSSPLP
jgi:hypothetical protein